MLIERTERTYLSSLLVLTSKIIIHGDGLIKEHLRVCASSIQYLSPPMMVMLVYFKPLDLNWWVVIQDWVTTCLPLF